MGTGLFSSAPCRKRNRMKHTAAGLCISCSEPAVEGLKKCRKHLDYNNEYCKMFREKQKKLNEEVSN